MAVLYHGMHTKKSRMIRRNPTKNAQASFFGKYLCAVDKYFVVWCRFLPAKYFPFDSFDATFSLQKHKQHTIAVLFSISAYSLPLHSALAIWYIEDNIM